MFIKFFYLREFNTSIKSFEESLFITEELNLFDLII